MNFILKKSCDSTKLTVDSVLWSEIETKTKKEILENVSKKILELDSFVYNEEFITSNSESEIEKYLLFLLGFIQEDVSKIHECKTCSHDIIRKEWNL